MYDDAVLGDGMVSSQRGAKLKIRRVPVLPNMRRLRPHCLDGAGRGAKYVLIRANTGSKRSASVAFLRFRADKGHGRRQASNKWSERCRHLADPCEVIIFSPELVRKY